jgi:hypothetical protein
MESLWIQNMIETRIRKGMSEMEAKDIISAKVQNWKPPTSQKKKNENNKKENLCSPI